MSFAAGHSCPEHDGDVVPFERIDMPSDKQLAFIRSLCAGHGIEFTMAGLCTKRDASKRIETLKALPRPAVTASAPSVEVPEGMHLHDGDVFRVQRSGAGHLYAKHRIDGAWEYEGRKPLARLSADTLVTLATAKEYGLATGMCCICSRTLTDPNSIAAGIGPICASKF